MAVAQSAHKGAPLDVASSCIYLFTLCKRGNANWPDVVDESTPLLSGIRYLSKVKMSLIKIEYH